MPFETQDKPALPVLGSACAEYSLRVGVDGWHKLRGAGIEFQAQQQSANRDYRAEPGAAGSAVCGLRTK
jgi:hypothetical protein